MHNSPCQHILTHITVITIYGQHVKVWNKFKYTQYTQKVNMTSSWQTLTSLHICLKILTSFLFWKLFKYCKYLWQNYFDDYNTTSFQHRISEKSCINWICIFIIRISHILHCWLSPEDIWNVHNHMVGKKLSHL
jgi:hypothetical protein